MKLYPHQTSALEQVKDKNKCALYLDMGLGKTYVGSEKMMQLGSKLNLVICQKSKLEDWLKHFLLNYGGEVVVYDLTDKQSFEMFMRANNNSEIRNYDFTFVGIINYEMAFRRPYLAKLDRFTLMLDESSMIQNEQAKRSKFILKMQPDNVILLSGTPTSGKYERLYSQIKLLGWKISKNAFWDTYIDTIKMDYGCGFPVKKVVGYKNIDRLKKKLAEHGAVFMQTDDVFDLPEQMEQTISVPISKEYQQFCRDSYIDLDTKNLCKFKDDSDFYGKDITPHTELIGETSLTKLLYERMLCGQYSKDKLDAFRDLLESTSDRLIVFYNFDAELDALTKIAKDYTTHISVVNGKKKTLTAYEKYDDSITFVQYQAGAMGLNLQKANKIIYYTPPLSCELFMQSKKRTHRIGQNRTCFYYFLTVKRSREEKIYKALSKGVDYTLALFEKEDS